MKAQRSGDAAEEEEEAAAVRLGGSRTLKIEREGKGERLLGAMQLRLWQ